MNIRIGVNQHEKNFGIADCFPRGLHHGAIQRRFGVVYTRSVQKNKLRVRGIFYARDFVSGCLRFIGDYRNLIADDSVEKCGFAHVGTADDPYKP
jgi:hypothetical protein